MLVAGIDVGCGSTKCVILDEAQRVRGRGLARTKADFEVVSREALEAALAAAAVRQGDLDYVATAGLGRYSVSFRDVQITDLTCAARGAHHLYPSTKFVLDMGAQSTRAVRLADDGKVKEFHMNEKCAAGSGGFLERVAKYLEVPIDQMGEMSLRSKAPTTISSICAVLAESEIINHVSEGQTVEDIIAGIHFSLADRAMLQLKRVGLNGELTFVGGVARQAGMIRAAREKFGVPVNVPEHPEFVVALGAAVLGLQRARKVRAGATVMAGR
jgi:predicted CoA-substrate-specific enzyme activase